MLVMLALILSPAGVKSRKAIKSVMNNSRLATANIALFNHLNQTLTVKLQCLNQAASAGLQGLMCGLNTEELVPEVIYS